MVVQAVLCEKALEWETPVRLRVAEGAGVGRRMELPLKPALNTGREDHGGKKSASFRGPALKLGARR